MGVRPMPVYLTHVIENKKRESKWFETHEEASNYLRLKAAMDFLNKIPPKGLSLEGRARIVLENIDNLQERLTLVDTEIEEFVKPTNGS